MIKFLDLKAINKRYKDEFKTAFNNFLDSGQYILGEEVSKFEKDFATYCGVNYCVGVSNGLDALKLILEAYILTEKLKIGDEIIVPANTFIATILAISDKGLVPILIEPEFETYNIDTREITKKITTKTKAIVGVHLYGQLYNAVELEKISKEYGLLLIEDAAQAQGAVLPDGRKAGNISDAAAFSFYPTKNLGALGDAGAITTNNEVLAETILKLRNYGKVSSYEYHHKGVNCRLDEIQAAFLNIKLNDLDRMNKIRRDIASQYLSGITNTKVKLPYYDGSAKHVFHQFVILVENREHFISYMLKNKVELGIHYPIAPHKQKAYVSFNNMSLPITEQIHKTCASLPIYNVLIREDINRVIYLVNNFS
ncbi:DegT/DnrJ/EryC1/StrS family aminotransferase [Flavobacteriaceae bacterium MHTCC 0001]